MTTAIAVQTPFAPQGIEQAQQLATTLAKSTLIPESLRNKPADVLVTLITGHELGLSPMQALRGMHVINGKAIMSSDLMVALVLKHRDVCEFFRLVESSDTKATYQTKRHGSDPVVMTWTMAQATAAGLSGKGTWKAHPAAMLRARCASALARAVYPDLVLGVYDPDEAAEFAVPVSRPVAPPVHIAPASPVVLAPAPQAEPAGEPEVVHPNVTAAAEALEAEVVDPVEDVIEAIKKAESRAQLVALIPLIKTLPSDRIAEVREAYKTRHEALS